METTTSHTIYTTAGGVGVTRRSEPVDPDASIGAIRLALDERRGVLLTSGFEYPGRYTRWDIGFVDPPLILEARSLNFSLHAANERGEVLLDACAAALECNADLESVIRDGRALTGVVVDAVEPTSEEERTRRPSVLGIVRALVALFGSAEDRHLGLYGAFGYDLVLQLERLRLRHARDGRQRDLVLYLPDELVVIDHQRGRAERHRYEFEYAGRSTAGRTGGGVASSCVHGANDLCGTAPGSGRDHAPGEFAALVRRAHEAFARGDLFEVTPSQLFRRPCTDSPATIFARLAAQNPAPYGFLMNLGEGEHLVGASPEMYVRVTGDRVETCPIAGTIARGSDALGDAAQIRRLLDSEKEEAELTMCTDVDRNDKARVCRPGSVRVIGRRQIELYSRLIHTVDHVEGRLRDGYDALDAFLTHAWAVTVTGAPKLAAMQFIEDHERSPRAFYGGSVGTIGFDGGINTGLTLRTMRIVDGVAEVRAGATLLAGSDPEAEEAECDLKASALLAALRRPAAARASSESRDRRPGAGRRVLLVDCEDSFVHTLADYLRQTGAEVQTLRHGFDASAYERVAPDLVVLSPGPGRPRDFRLSRVLDDALTRGLPVFGVCLGLQAMVEHFGGTLGQLAQPAHGRSSLVRVLGGRLFEGLPRDLRVGRYHSLYGERATLPRELAITAETEDGLVMAIEHAVLPLAAVQFHPESIMSAEGGFGLRLLANVWTLCDPRLR